jgi:hypothetical protein
MNGHCSQSLLATRTTCCPSGVRGGFTGGLEALELRIVRMPLHEVLVSESGRPASRAASSFLYYM